MTGRLYEQTIQFLIDRLINFIALSMRDLFPDLFQRPRRSVTDPFAELIETVITSYFDQFLEKLWLNPPETLTVLAALLVSILAMLVFMVTMVLIRLRKKVSDEYELPPENQQPLPSKSLLRRVIDRMRCRRRFKCNA